ncbi:GNAT family N-acetyltransferase [Streptomyces lavendulae]
MNHGGLQTAGDAGAPPPVPQNLGKGAPVRTWIAGLLGDHPAWLGAYGHRLIVERDSGLIVGSIGLFWPPADGVLELGYGIVSSRRGRGYATEATRAVSEFALATPGVHTVAAGVELSNPASVRVLEKAGFERHDTTLAETAEGTARFVITRHDRRS